MATTEKKAQKKSAEAEKTPAAPAPAVAAVPQTQPRGLALELPVARHGSVKLGRIECKLTPRQSTALRLLFDGLQARGATILLGGTKPEPITSQHDALRWVLDQIADQTEKAGG
jgi:hypothetical protein